VTDVEETSYHDCCCIWQIVL